MRWQRVATGSAVLILLAVPTFAIAQGGPFGIGTPEPTGAAWAGPFAPLFAKIAEWQSDFYQRLTSTLSDMKENGGAFWLLAGVSFLYGIFHAAGPGHGKAVISAYLLASDETLRRGVVISFAAAFVQAMMAIAVVGLLAGILNVTAVQMTETTNLLEIGSYGLIVLVGVWLLWTRIRGHSHSHNHVTAEAVAGSATRTSSAQRVEAHAHHFDHHHDGSDHGGHHHDHADRHGQHHANDAHDDHHDHSHAPDPALLTRPLTLGSAWTAVLAVGIRPCSGAIIVLVFALAQGLFLAGVGATFIMSLGTAITVSALAALAVVARDFAVRFAGDRGRLRMVGKLIEVAAALAVIALGALLLGGALSA